MGRALHAYLYGAKGLCNHQSVIRVSTQVETKSGFGQLRHDQDAVAKVYEFIIQAETDLNSGGDVRSVAP
jgi:hypothetical protein